MLLLPKTIKLINHVPPDELYSWLTYPQSLTKRLEDEVGEAYLTILKQGWRNQAWWDRYKLKFDGDQQVFHREIVISAKSKPCWYARTIIPANTYYAHLEFFSRLEQESLGHLIFCSNDVARLSLNYYLITPESIEYYWLKPIIPMLGNLWGRLSVFTISTHYLFYLVEIFLPDLLKVIYAVD
jgi:chorismate--pyruvate lyase